MAVYVWCKGLITVSMGLSLLSKLFQNAWICSAVKIKLWIILSLRLIILRLLFSVSSHNTHQLKDVYVYAHTSLNATGGCLCHPNFRVWSIYINYTVVLRILVRDNPKSWDETFLCSSLTLLFTIADLVLFSTKLRIWSSNTPLYAIGLKHQKIYHHSYRNSLKHQKVYHHSYRNPSYSLQTVYTQPYYHHHTAVAVLCCYLWAGVSSS